ncbi:rhombosortase [Vibrio rhizosphaerae]|uniref:Rhombosortase n=1 Tax=Vibrio rhizosphaerae TaxID=398736 RepID=A0ABU4ISZ0_9VIBR|nr:rhombosortase [Vibrio rhizosphaerae]MDW6092399.1 rhombosortase [Vibrio rhizosphaerae]
MRFLTLNTITRSHLYLTLSLISVMCVLAQWPPLADLLVWNRQAIMQGQWWRIVTGNFTHTNIAHLSMNLIALWLISLIFRPAARGLWQQLLLLSLLIGIGLFWSDLYFYVGLSGILHGLFASFALGEALQGRKSSWLLVVGVCGKVIWEQCFGASEATQALIEAPVAIQAHLLGLAGGLFLGCSTRIKTYWLGSVG